VILGRSTKAISVVRLTEADLSQAVADLESSNRIKVIYPLIQMHQAWCLCEPSWAYFRKLISRQNDGCTQLVT